MSFEKYNNGKYARYTSGGYPLVYMTADDSTLCPACANGENGNEGKGVSNLTRILFNAKSCVLNETGYDELMQTKTPSQFHSLPALRELDRVNVQLSQAVSLTAELKAITGRIVGVKGSK